MMPINMEKNWRDLIKPKALEVDAATATHTYGKFICRPLERGFGTTLGNSLRRVLLSSLQGTGVAAVRIQGVQHEFTTIPDVQEDVTDLILNLKQLRMKMLSQHGEVTVSINKEGTGVVRASDIDTGGAIELLDPNQYICTLGKEGKLQAELLVKTGRGFVNADQNKDSDLPIGWIAIDTTYSPINKVNYAVTHARVGQRTDFDRLQMEVWTDGSVNPEDAVALSAKIVRDQMTVFMNFEEEEEPVEEEVASHQEQFSANLYRPVEELELSVRSANCLQNANIKFIYELVQRSEAEMLRTKNFGRKSLNEIKEMLHKMGLGLGMKLDGFVAPTNAAAPAAKKPEVAPMDSMLGGSAPMGGNTDEGSSDDNDGGSNPGGGGVF